MVFILTIAVIIIAVVLHDSKKENKELKKRIYFLEGKIQDLYDKAFYTYDQLKQLQNSNAKDVESNGQTLEDVPENIPAQTQPAQSKVPPMPSSEQQFNPYRKLENIPTIFKDEKTPGMNISPNENEHRQSVPQYASPQNILPQQKNAVSQNVSPQQKYAPQYYQNINQEPASKIPPKYEKKTDDAPQLKSFENWLGTRLFNVVASLMIFIGLVLFCTLGYEYITNTMKMAAMFLVSSGFIALGAFFTRQNKSVFSLGLTGCGFGAFFISILLSHVYFHALIDIAAFGLILVWAMFALYMSKKLDSVMLSVTAHMGTAVSICFAFSLGFSEDKIILPVSYQIAAIAVIIIGNIFCCKKTYRFGLFMSMLLLIYTSIVMCVTFGSSSVMPGKVSPIFTIVIFAIQFIAISFTSYLITISTAALENEKTWFEDKNEIMIMAHISNKVLWTVGIITSVGVVTGFTLKNAFNINGLLYPTLAVCFAAVGHLFVTLFMSEKLNFNEKLSKLSIWFNSVVVMLALFVQAADRNVLHGVPFLCVYTGLVMLIIRYTKNKKLNHLVAFLIGCEMMFMGLYGYFATANVVISIVYMVIIGIEVLLHWFMQSGESRERRFTFFKMAEYLWLSVSIIPINVSEFSNISFPLILSEFALMNIITYLCKYGRDNEPELKLTVKIESLLTVYVSIAALAFDGLGSLGNILAIKIVFIILSAALTALYVKDFVKSDLTAVQVVSAVTVSGFITAFFIGFSESIAVANVYTNVLQCKPLFLISTLVLILIYNYNKNHELRVFIWSFLGMDMFLMSFFGYHELFNEYGKEMFTYIVTVTVCVLHAIIVTALIYYLWKLQSEENKPSSLIPIKIVAYFWVNVSSFIIILGAIENTIISKDFVLVILTLINTVLYLKKYHKNSNVIDTVVKISSSIILYISILVMAVKVSSDSVSVTSYFIINYTIRIALILLSLGLYYLISRELLKTKSVCLQAYVGLTATFIVNAACRGLSSIFTIQYIFSIVTMITALICIVAGFTTKTKGLRVYGLIVVMLCVIKLVTFDISAADSMSRVVAFVVGGVVCFVISGIYNKVESKLLSENK